MKFVVDVEFYANPAIGEDSTLALRGIYNQKTTQGVSNTQKH